VDSRSISSPPPTITSRPSPSKSPRQPHLAAQRNHLPLVWQQVSYQGGIRWVV
jgi:hypothetical protein